MNVNRVLLSGNLTRDPELRMTGGGTPVLSFRVAVNDKRGGEEHTGYFDCFCFGNFATTMEKYLGKGQKVVIDGQLSYRSWEKDGQERSKVEIVVRTLDMVGSAPARGAYDYQQGQQIPLAAAPPQVDLYDEPIPF